MIERLSLGQRRLLALGILLLALAAAFSVTVWPVLLANRHYQETVDALHSRLQQLRRAAAIGESLKPQYQQLESWRMTDAQYLKSTSAALAAAELQRLVKRIVEARKAELVSSQTLTTRQEEGFDRISLKVRIQGDLESVVRVFYDLETSEPFLFLDNVSVRARGGRRLPRRVSTEQTLDIDMELIGYMPHAS